ncbi:unnamed protein product, partial [Staurois parvus]
MYTDHQGTDGQCALMISVVPALPPVSVHQCLVSVVISASCQCPSVPSVPHQCHISAYQCTSVPHISAYQCTSMPHISAYQYTSMQHFSAYQCTSM